MTDEQARAQLIQVTLDQMKQAIELRKQVIRGLIDIGWTAEQAAQLEGACERAVRRWMDEGVTA